MLVAPLGAASTAKTYKFICGNFVRNAVRHDEATRSHFRKALKLALERMETDLARAVTEINGNVIRLPTKH
jgi:hypothetical protein